MREGGLGLDALGLEGDDLLAEGLAVLGQEAALDDHVAVGKLLAGRDGLAEELQFEGVEVAVGDEGGLAAEGGLADVEMGGLGEVGDEGGVEGLEVWGVADDVEVAVREVDGEGDGAYEFGVVGGEDIEDAVLGEEGVGGLLARVAVLEVVEGGG